MRLFPHVHLTADLDARLVDHLQRHGLRVVGADDDPDVVVLLPGTGTASGTASDPESDAAADRAADGAAALVAGRATSPGLVVVLDAAPTPDLDALLRAHGVGVHPTSVAVPTDPSAPTDSPVALCSPATDPAAAPAEDLLAWADTPRLPARVTLDVTAPAVPALWVGGPQQGSARTAPVVAAFAASAQRLVVLGVDVTDPDASGSAAVLLNAVLWAARREPAPVVATASAVPVRAVPDERSDAPDLADHPSWTALKEAVTALQSLQGADGAVPDPADHERARALVATAGEAVATFATLLPHDEEHLAAVGKDLVRWAEGGFKVPDFLDSLTAFHPERQRVDGLVHLVVFPMYTQNGSPDRHLEAVLLKVRWPQVVADLEAQQFSNPMFVPVTFLDFTAGYDTNSAVLFPETVAVREVPAFTWGAIFADREAARFRRVVRAAAETTRLALPPDAARLLADQRLAEETFVLWDLVHDRTHMRGDLPFDPFMIKQRMPYFLYSLEELRCDLTAFRAAVRLEAEGVPHARLVQYAVLFDRLFRFPVTGGRVRNYDGLGGQLLFAWLHRHGVLHWTDSRLTLDWPRVPDAVLALGEQIEQLYWRSIDRPKSAHWLAAYALVAGTLEPHPASVWAQGPSALPVDGPPKGLTDAVLPDEFPLSMFYEALGRKIGDVVASTSGIVGSA